MTETPIFLPRLPVQAERTLEVGIKCQSKLVGPIIHYVWNLWLPRERLIFGSKNTQLT